MKKCVVLAGLIFAAGLTASAIPVLPGEFVLFPTAEPPPAGAVLDQIIAPFAGADVQGEVISTVLIDDVSNPFGGLTFTYEILVDRATTHPLGQLSVGNYGPFMTDMSFSPIIPGVAPVYMDRSITGDVLNFDFSIMSGPGIWGGESSALLVVRTDSFDYNPTIGSVVNSGSAEVQTFAPIAVPEPASMALIGLFTGGIYFVRRFFIA